MGRVKSTPIKSLGDDIVRQHRDKLKTDFESNKKVLDGLMEIKSKRIRNIVAGYITKKMKVQKK
jgi:small subunit ribosomal protein S17e